MCQADSPLDDRIAIHLYRFTKLVFADAVPVTARQPEYHLVTHEKRQRMLQLVFGLNQAACNCHERAREDAFCSQWSHQCLKVGRQSEWHWLRVVEERLRRAHE